MKLEKAMIERRSIRGFKDEPVSKALLEDVIALANRAPSSMNTQPWHLHVLTGKPLEAVRHGNTERMLAGVTLFVKSKTMLHMRESIENVRSRSLCSFLKLWVSSERMQSGVKIGS